MACPGTRQANLKLKRPACLCLLCLGIKGSHHRGQLCHLLTLSLMSVSRHLPHHSSSLPVAVWLSSDTNSICSFTSPQTTHLYTSRPIPVPRGLSAPSLVSKVLFVPTAPGCHEPISDLYGALRPHGPTSFSIIPSLLPSPCLHGNLSPVWHCLIQMPIPRPYLNQPLACPSFSR